VNITVVTPWHNQRELADDYYAAIQAGQPTEVIVVDNGSDPPLNWPGIRLDDNTGFCHACNVGLRAAATDAVLFLNNDVGDAKPGWLDAIREGVAPGVLVGPYRNDWHTQVDGEVVPYLDGWCLAGMREDLLELGGFDETLAEPAYYSDNLLCLEARAAGFTLREVRVELQHKTSVTAKTMSEDVDSASKANRARYTSRVRELRGDAAFQPGPGVVGANA